MEMNCAPPVCYKSEMEVYGLSVMKSNFISVTLTVCTRTVLEDGSAPRSGMEVRFGVYKRCKCEVHLDCDRIKSEVKKLEMEVWRLE